jgi:hypothetical protein
MDLMQKLFEKYGELSPLEAVAIIPVKSLQPDCTRRYTGKHLPD